MSEALRHLRAVDGGQRGPRDPRGTLAEAGYAGPSPQRGGVSDEASLPAEDDGFPGDPELIRRCLDGLSLDDGSDPFAALMTRHQRRAFWVAYHVVGGVEDARDVVQDSFLRLHRSLNRFDFARSFPTWFHRIVVNLAIDHLRRMKARPAGSLEPFGDRLAGDLDTTDGARRGETRDRVWRTLQRLDAKYRAVLVLRDIHDMSCREIAVVLGVTHATARWRLHRSRQMFATAWHATSGDGPFSVDGASPPDAAQAGGAP